MSGAEQDRGRGHEHEATPLELFFDLAVVESDNHVGIAQKAARDVLSVLAGFRIKRMACRVDLTAEIPQTEGSAEKE